MGINKSSATGLELSKITHLVGKALNRRMEIRRQIEELQGEDYVIRKNIEMWHKRRRSLIDNDDNEGILLTE